MSRDFEFQQLLRAYRKGIISQSTFESEMASLEAAAPTTNGNGNGGAGFKAFGRTYKSERAAVVSFLDKVRVGEANGGEAFAAWAEVCTTDCIRTGIRIVAEREAYHSRVFAQRLAELGGEARAMTSEAGRKATAYLGDPSIPDNEKLLDFTKRVGKPEDAIKPDLRVRRTAEGRSIDQGSVAAVRRRRALDGEMDLGFMRRAQRAQAGCVSVSIDVVTRIGSKLRAGPQRTPLFLSSDRATQCAAGAAPAAGAPPSGAIFVAPGFIIIPPGPGRSRLV